jgi:hypothetical protein
VPSPVILGARGLAGPQPAGPVESRPALRTGRDQSGAVGRFEGPGERLRLSTRLLLVQRDVRRRQDVAGVDLLEHVGVGGVDRPDVDEARLLGQHVRQQRVAEPHHLVGEGQHSSADPVAYRVVERAYRHTGRKAYALEQVDDPRAASHGENPGEIARGLGEGMPAGGDGVQQPVRRSGRRTGAAGGQALDEELGEVGVAVGALVDVRDQVVRGGTPGQSCHLFLGLLGTEAPHGEVVDGRITTQIGQPHVERVSLGPLLGADEEHQTEPLGVEPGDDIGEHVAGGDVRPVQVVDDPQRRTDPVQLVDEVVRRLKHRGRWSPGRSARSSRPSAAAAGGPPPWPGRRSGPATSGARPPSAPHTGPPRSRSARRSPTAAGTRGPSPSRRSPGPAASCRCPPRPR